MSKATNLNMKYLFPIILLLLCMRSISLIAQEYKIVTFNIREDLKKDGLNCWKYRKHYLIPFLDKKSPDIICLQEARLNQTEDIGNRLINYGIVDIARNKRFTLKGTVPILYRKDKFVVLNMGYFSLSEHPDSLGRIGWDAKYPRVAIWANLKDLETGNIFFIINTHLDNSGKQARHNGIKQITDTIPKLSKCDNIILTGDFNSTEKSVVYKYVILHNLIDSYRSCSRRNGVTYTYHNFGRRELSKRKKIDFVFVSKNFDPLYVSIPQDRNTRGTYMSDHNPVITTLHYNGSVVGF